MTTQHTPLPWKFLKIRPAEPDSDFEIYSGAEGQEKSIATVNGLNMAPGEAKANLAIILRACNAHDMLEQTLDYILPWAKTLSDKWEAQADRSKKCSTNEAGVIVGNIKTALEALKNNDTDFMRRCSMAAAIAKAEGK